MDEVYIVLVETDERAAIVAINSDAFLLNPEGWIEIDRGYGDRYHHAQRNYLPRSIMTDGVPRYKLVDGAPVERTAEEIAADIAALPAQEATEADYIVSLESLGVQFNE